MKKDLEHLRFPVGRFRFEGDLTPEARTALVDEIAALPAALRMAVAGLSDAQLDTPYRPEGWTLRQVVHHVPDSHMNAYVRFRLALTEDAPTIRPYMEDRWAELPDALAAPPEVSLVLLEALHDRWVRLLRAMSPSDFARTLHHPESGFFTLDKMLALYAWHSRHHLAHVTSLRERMGWPSLSLRDIAPSGRE